MEHSDLQDVQEGVAIVGMSCRFPGAKNIDEFWHNLRNGIESISFFSDEELTTAGVDPELLSLPNYVKAGLVLDNIDKFDASFFGYTPREAEVMDPQQRLFLECAWEAFEHAGYNPLKLAGLTGLFLGASDNDYIVHVYGHQELYDTLGANHITYSNSGDHINMRVSYKFNLTGPSINVRCGCSSALLAVHMAYQSLMSYQCDMMLAGGVSINPSPPTGYLYQEGGILSPDGHCRAFDEQAKGTIFGNGLGAVVLKRIEDALRDGDTIYAVIKGGAINNDGSSKVGYTAPGIDGQAAVIMEAQSIAQVDPATITYIEAHGTGTTLGDPIELKALTRAFSISTDEKGYCAIGSVKTNIGHLDHAAGIAGLLKTTLMLYHKEYVPSLHFKSPNPQLDLEHSPFFVSTSLMPWNTRNGEPRRAGISSFGIGGTNVHMILEEASAFIVAQSTQPSHNWQVLTLSARTPSALEQLSANLADHITTYPKQSLPDIAYTLQVGRKHFEHQRIIVCNDRANAFTQLKSKDAATPGTIGTYKEQECSLVFLFSGQGSQYAGMANELYQTEDIFQREIDRCASILYPLLGEDLRALLFASNDEQASERLRQTHLAQPTLFALEYALAQLLISWGIKPDAMIGHSIGEYVAACLANVFTLEEGLRLVATRGRLMQQTAPGAMLSILQAESEVLPLLDKDMGIAAVNSPTTCVVSGKLAGIETLEKHLDSLGIKYRRLEVSHAFHSCTMDPILDDFRAVVHHVKLHAPTRPYISNVTGAWITASEATNPEYWVQHLRQPVQFAQGVKLALEQPNTVMLEVGPGQALKALVQQQMAGTKHTALSTIRRRHEKMADEAFLMQAIGRLWMSGIAIDWTRVHGTQRQRVPLPTYPFERQSYWLDINPTLLGHVQTGGNGQPSSTTATQPKETEHEYQRQTAQTTYVAPRTLLEHAISTIWKKQFGLQDIGIYDDFFELGGHSLLAIQLIAQVREACNVNIPVQTLLEHPTIAKLAQIIEKQLASQQNDTTLPANETTLDLEADAVLDPAITPEYALPWQREQEPKAILLTGATGFIGAYLLNDLLRDTQATIYCLVRSSSQYEARRYLKRQMEEKHLWQEQYSNRIVPVPGDLGQPLLGLSQEGFTKLADTIDMIYHNGARVNFLYPYQTLKPTNVLGTQEILRLACYTRVKPVHYISSIAVFELDDYGYERVSEETVPRYNSSFENAVGYAQSKWVAERLILTARERGVPTAIYRLGTVSGHSKTGVSNTTDLLYRWLIGCIRIGAAPTIQMDADITPVDYVSRAIIHLSKQPQAYEKIFHLINSSLIPWQEIIDWLLEFGYDIRRMPYSSWQKELHAKATLPENADLWALPQIFAENAYPDAVQPVTYQQQLSRYTCKNTLEGLKGTFITCPIPDPELLGTYLAYLVSQNIITAPSAVHYESALV